MATLAATSCHACGKSGCKLLRCGRCRTVWFCNRECQVVAARQGHSGDNCCPAEAASTHTDATVAPRLSTRSTAGVNSALLGPAASSCLACGKSGGKLLLCGQCKNVFFCSRECQIVARKELGHRGKNCRAADGDQSAATFTLFCSSIATLHVNGRFALCSSVATTHVNIRCRATPEL